MSDPAAKLYYVITLKGDLGPYSRGDLIDALRAGEVRGEDQVRTAFGRQLGTVAQLASAPTSDRTVIRREPPRPAARPWLVPLLVGLAVVGLVAALWASRGGGDPYPDAPAPEPLPAQPVAPTAQPAPAPPAATPAPPPAQPSADMLSVLAEAKDYRLVYDLDLRRLDGQIRYSVDNSAVPGSFKRVAYLLELTTNGGPSRFLWAAMDSFTSKSSRTGVPTLASRIFYQVKVANLQVRSNSPLIQNGDFPTGGSIEFWPSDYIEARSGSMPMASSDVFDVSDTPKLAANGSIFEGYGCMQVHNAGLRQTLFAFNHWTAGQRADLGIGNAPKGMPDWTFADNLAGYSAARLRVLVR